MKLILLYGSPAVGKLTVAKELKQKIGYKLLDNHLLQNPITEVFPYENPASRVLVREFRLRILEEAVKSDINLIATFGIAGNNPFEHMDDIVRTVESQGGKIYLVQLIADKETILNRVGNESRREHGKDLSRERLEELFLKNPDIFDKYPKREHLTIDTIKLSPEEAATQIVKQFNLV